MSTDIDVSEAIDRAADAVAPVWPLHSFVTANPLAGLENRPFHEAVREGARLFGGDGYPGPDTFRRAWERGRIDPDVLESRLAGHGYDATPETLLDRMTGAGTGETTSSGSADDAGSPTDRVDALLTKWLAAFLDEGKAHWSMPGREDGFYAAVRSVAPHDREIPDGDRLADLPADPVAAIRALLADYPGSRWPAIFESHLAALPGWTGFIRRRIADDGAWQSAYPISLPGYLAVRLALSDLLGAPIAPAAAEGRDAGTDGGDVPLPEVWLSAWEATYRRELVDALTDGSAVRATTDGNERRTSPGAVRATTDGNERRTSPGADRRPDAQFVFCIDTRSEVIRRHVEATGNYETHGYAGFFGIPMRYDGYDADAPVDACPPILDAEHRIADRPTGDARASHDHWSNVLDAGRDVVDALKTNAATAFSFVESAGAGYGLALAARTLLPARVYDALDAADERVPDAHEFCEPSFDHDPDAGTDLPAGLALEEKVEYAASAFELMGWEEFARVVAFVGHAAQTANNPFDSSLDCGACAGNPGGPSARVLAAICNDEAVRAELRDRGIEIPEDTVFVAGEHNTTTDEVTLYDGDVPGTHDDDVKQLRADLDTARRGAAAERAADMGADAATDGDPPVAAGVRETERRAADWAETRPEWGLAGNAAFVIGPRDLTADLDLDARAFLHSYDWRTDPDGDALEAIMAGPMVVTQWINCQYYFATVDTAVYGSGSKVTHNPVGNVGVHQGNGGDLVTGLPLQSVMAADDDPYHQPIRLSTVIHAPVDRVTDVLSTHGDLATLLDNGWLSLVVVDPTRDHAALRYDGDLDWAPAFRIEPPTEDASPVAPVADD